jgi:hypothetical protein
MENQDAQISIEPFAGSRRRNPRITAVASALLSKTAKHLALLACLLIVGKATGRLTAGQFAIFCLTIFAALAHLTGHALSRRLPAGSFKIPP